MSEFKFACPVCGQHITADSKDTGSQISCPTCFRKIVVPQAPSSAESKFVLSASEANKPRPPQPGGAEPEPVQKGTGRTAIPVSLIALLVLACAAGATLFALRGKFSHKQPDQNTQNDSQPNQVDSPNSAPNVVARPAQPLFAGESRWTLDLSTNEIPDEPVSGSIHQRAFALERATLSGSNLTLRIGHSGSVELGVNIAFFNRLPEELSGRTAEVKPTDQKAPRVVLHWMEAERKSATFRNGYAMKVEFGSLSNNAIPGKLYLSVPDESKSWVAGTFRAEIRKPSPPRNRPPQ